MAFDFPNAPTPGSVYSPAGGPSYTWDGQKWTMTGSPVSYTPAYANRNRIVNGAMQISQENGNTSQTTVGSYPADQWTFGTAIASVSIARFSAQPPASPSPWISTSLTTAKSSLAAGDYWQVLQYTEGNRTADFLWGTANAKQAILRFTALTNAPGTYSVLIQNGAVNRTFLAPFTVTTAGTWTTFVILIPGDTTGTWPTDNTRGLTVGFGLASGTTWQGTAGWQAGQKIQIAGHANLAATANNYLSITNVGLYLDAAGSGIPPAWEMPDEADELIACQRYYQIARTKASENATAGTAVHWAQPLRVTMRTAPGVTITGAAYVNASGLAMAASLDHSIDFTMNTTAAGSGVAGGLATMNARM